MTEPTRCSPLIPGAILASGWSQRMGRSKALLPAGRGGQTFVRTLAATLQDGGVTDVLVIGRPDDASLRSEVATLGAGVRYVENHHAAQGQISSIVAAVNAVDHPGVQGLLVIPVDQPLIAAATVAALLLAFSRTRPPIARATHQGRHGHPVVFASALFGELRRADPSQGARVVVRAHAAEALDVDVADPNVLIDIDDSDAYERVFGLPVPTGN
ncbi:MAG: nucleotidyltransferase family protein [Vicinamibacterales bacterium]